MIYRVVVPSHVERQIVRLAPILKRQIRNALDEIAENPHVGKALRQDLKGLYSYRVRHYRIVYSIHSDVVEVHLLAIGPRTGIYQSL